MDSRTVAGEGAGGPCGAPGLLALRFGVADKTNPGVPGRCRHFRGSEAGHAGCYLDRMRTRFDALTILFGLLILVAVTAGVMA